MYLVQYFEILCLILNLIWLTCFWIYTTKDIIYPKFIQSSLNPLVSKYKYKSYLLNQIHSSKTLNSSVSKEDFKTVNYNVTKNNFKNVEDYFLLQNQDYIYILRISKRKKMRLNKSFGKITLFKTAISDFIKSSLGDSLSIISKCWSSSIKGKIISTKLSDDNMNLLIQYKINKGPYKHYRIRFFHSLLNTEFNKTLNNLYSDKHSVKSDIYNNYFDDFSIKGNYKIDSFTVKKNVIACSRSSDFHSFYLLKRKQSELGIEWKIQYKGLTNDFIYFHSNYIKFMEMESPFKYSLVNVFLEINQDRNFAVNVDIYNLNKTIYSIDEETSQSYISNFDVKLERRFEYRLGQVELPLKQSLKNYVKPLLLTTSTSSSNIILIEIKENTLFSLQHNSTENKYNFLEILKGNIEGKIERIKVDNEGKNFILQYENSNDLYLILREDLTSNKTYYSINLISKDSFPIDLRPFSILAFDLKSINSHTFLLVLLENGILISFDLTNVENRWTIKNLFFSYLRDLDFREWAKLNIIFNSLNFLQIIFISIASLFSDRRLIRNRLNQILEDAARMNDNLQRNVQQIITNQNQLVASQPEINSNEMLAFANTNNILQIHIQRLLTQANSLTSSLSNSSNIIVHVNKILTILQIQIRYIDLFFQNMRTTTSSTLLIESNNNNVVIDERNLEENFENHPNNNETEPNNEELMGEIDNKQSEANNIFSNECNITNQSITNVEINNT